MLSDIKQTEDRLNYMRSELQEKEKLNYKQTTSRIMKRIQSYSSMANESQME